MKRALVGVDLTEGSGLIEALPSLRRWGIEEVVLTHVVRPSPVPVLHRIDGTKGVSKGLSLANAELGRRFSVELAIRSGDPARELAGEARERGAEAIVLGLGKRVRPRERFGGRTLRWLLRRAGLPVFLLPPMEAGSSDRPGAPSPPLRIVFPTDFSPVASQAIPFICDLVARTGASVQALHVLEGAGSRGERRARRKISRLAEELGAAGAPAVTWAVERGVPWQRIVSNAASQEGSLVVMGVHARAVLPELVLGSQSRQVILHARFPLLLAPPGVGRRAIADLQGAPGRKALGTAPVPCPA